MNLANAEVLAGAANLLALERHQAVGAKAVTAVGAGVFGRSVLVVEAEARIAAPQTGTAPRRAVAVEIQVRPAGRLGIAVEESCPS